MNILRQILTALIILNCIHMIGPCPPAHAGIFDILGLASRKLEKGQIYKDPNRRFEAACPVPNGELEKARYGVTFSFMDGCSNYMVIAYDKPLAGSNVELSIDNTLKGLKAEFKDQGIDLSIAREEAVNYRGYDALNFDFMWVSNRKDTSSRVYVSRLIETENFVYWLCYSSAFWASDEAKLEERDYKNAEEFFDGVKLEKEF